ncbi:MAG: hypothetical protein ACOY32_03125 [Thermodesulfobacteriota bacterium]
MKTQRRPFTNLMLVISMISYLFLLPGVSDAMCMFLGSEAHHDASHADDAVLPLADDAFADIDHCEKNCCTIDHTPFAFPTITPPGAPPTRMVKPALAPEPLSAGATSFPAQPPVKTFSPLKTSQPNSAIISLRTIVLII